MKKLELALLLGLAASICCSSLAKAADSRAKLEDNVLRLHILANSDSIDDQALKLKVRNRVLEYTGKLLKNPGDTLEQAEQIVTEHLEELEDLAEAVVTEEGYAYPVSARLTEMPFEDRVYGNLTMPAGTYDALRITIGAAEGQNWWCVVYPPLCTASCTAWEDTARCGGMDEGDVKLMAEEDGFVLKFRAVELWERLRQRMGK